MSASRADLQQLYVVGDSPLHALDAAAKLAGLVVFVVAVALTPRRAVGAFAVDAVAVAAVVALARLPVRLVIARLAVILPFVAVALLVPFVGTGERVDVGWFSLSVDGLWASWGIVAKASLGAAASIVLAATTPLPELLHAMRRLHIPRVLVAIVGFMFRYLGLLTDQLGRMRTAMVARGHDPRWLWQVRPLASSLGVLFVRSYERGERVHGAMLARGYIGQLPALDDRRARPREWIVAAIPGVVASIALAVALVLETGGGG